ncbi:unnamed protein product [Clonostachys rosea]|uniref:Uncharacterized protein n=1 Tax=Bionectria ochroleuca TaxID=29856 RepID=A0ABY6TYW8_BIOOC|nr:unnamed protein product [Clonostachys rosea]
MAVKWSMAQEGKRNRKKDKNISLAEQRASFMPWTAPGFRLAPGNLSPWPPLLWLCLAILRQGSIHQPLKQLSFHRPAKFWAQPPNRWACLWHKTSGLVVASPGRKRQGTY